MPPSCMQGTVADFYSAMDKEESHFRALYTAAEAKGKKLKFVAKYEHGKAGVGLQEIDPQHDFLSPVWQRQCGFILYRTLSRATIGH